MALEKAVEQLKAAGEPTRLRLLSLLARAELTVSEVTQILKQSQPRVSRHLRLLCEAGLVDRFREGAWVFYRAAETGGGANLVQYLSAQLSPNDPHLFRDFERLEAIRSQRNAEAQAYFAANAAGWDRLRKLHVAEGEVEAGMLRLLKGRRLRQHLDIGTGTGRIIELFAPQCERAIGIDLNPEMLALARAKLARAMSVSASGEHIAQRVQVRLGDLYELPFEAHGFDLVTIHQVLHFLEEPGAAVSEAARMLAPGGVLLIVDFAPHGHEFLRTEHQHRRLGFQPRDVAGWIEGAGLKLLETIALPPDAADGLTVTLWLGQAKAELAGRGTRP